MIPKEFNFLAQTNAEENEPKGIKMREKASKCCVWVQTLGSHTQGILRNAHKKTVSKVIKFNKALRHKGMNKNYIYRQRDDQNEKYRQI